MRLPINALKGLAIKFGYSVVVVYAYDSQNKIAHIATWGRTIKECDQAAQWGNLIKDALGWPESLHAVPNRVKKLQDRIAELEEGNRWIPVSERLPDELVQVEVVGNGWDHPIRKGRDVGWIHLGDWVSRIWGITHWRPQILPPMPESEEK